MPLPLAFMAGKAAVPAASFISKNLISLLIGGGILGSQVLGEVERKGERKLSRERMLLEAKLAESSAEAGKTATAESRKRTKEYTDQLLKIKREERAEARDVAAMESFSRSQDRQMTLLLQAVQAMSVKPGGASTQAPGGGMLGLMRGGN